MLNNFTGISDNRIAPVAAKMLQESGQALIIAGSVNRANRIAQDLAFFASVPVYVLPDIEAASFKYEAKSQNELAQRLKVLEALIRNESCIVVAPAIGALKKYAPKSYFAKNITTIKIGDEVDRDIIIKNLVALGYERTQVAEARGQFAIRGDIIDIFVSGEDNPFRIELFDTEVDSIRKYDSLTQRSIENLQAISLFPARIIPKDDDVYQKGLKNVLKAYSKAEQSNNLTQDNIDSLREKRDYLIDCIEEGINPQYLEGYIEYFYDDCSFIWDYMQNLSFVMMDDPTRVAEILDFYTRESEENKKGILAAFDGIKEDFKSMPCADDMLKINNIKSELGTYYCTPFAQQIRFTDRLDDIKHFDVIQAPVFAGHMDVLENELKSYVARGYKIIIACSTTDRYLNLKDFLDRAALLEKVTLKEGNLTCGSQFNDEKVLYLAESDIFKTLKVHRKTKKNKAGAIKAFTDIKKGDYVVHEAHGVGLFTGVEKLEIDGSIRDYLKISYAGGDYLYVPVDKMDSIQKYVGSEGVTPKIQKLSGTDWAVTKEKAKAAIKEMTADLLKVSAQRSIATGYVYGEDSAWQKEFEDAFPYQETDDQLRCAEEIKHDMQSGKAMDRLLCGDVGYGKTEVAARAIFKALEAGKQVAVLVPTTILASQHYRTFKDRFAAYPFAVDMLCRFRTDKEQAQTIKKLETGEVDLVVGTHRLLSSDVKFKDLGLLVIDEEQRFGVEHKETIKKLKSNVDVLTLSATPIPRTLHMSLIGVRDMSVIEEPPEDRYPVQTYVMEQDDRTITDAIRRELGRGGQVYLVYNRVRGISAVARHIKELVPEANISVAHGQMGEASLENVMLDFADGKSNVLITTTIIESGLDIPNVNTLIVLDADRFGLSQLYQLRGRVGRSNRLAYAYLMFKKDKVLSETAEKRLRAIREFTEFGSGFRVAMRDLEIRGAGNLLGAEQSGHMLAIGYELYCKLVEDAVYELSGKDGDEKPIESDTEVEIGLSAFLPETYVYDELTRLDLYKRIASVSTPEERDEAYDELLDRFGDLPQEASNLLDVALIKNLASKSGIKKVVKQLGKLVFLFDERNALSAQKYALLMDAYGPAITIYGGVEPRITLAFGKNRIGEAALKFFSLFLSR